MRTSRPCWQCEYADCSHVWLATSEVPPKQCAGCRRRGWHKTLDVVPSAQALLMAMTGPVFVDAQGDALPAMPLVTVTDAVASTGGKVTISQPMTARPPMPSRPQPRQAVSKGCSDCGAIGGMHQRWCKKGGL